MQPSKVHFGISSLFKQSVKFLMISSKALFVFNNSLKNSYSKEKYALKRKLILHVYTALNLRKLLIVDRDIIKKYFRAQVWILGSWAPRMKSKKIPNATIFLSILINHQAKLIRQQNCCIKYYRYALTPDPQMRIFFGAFHTVSDSVWSVCFHQQVWIYPSNPLQAIDIL